jgi:hypothetical protein
LSFKVLSDLVQNTVFVCQFKCVFGIEARELPQGDVQSCVRASREDAHAHRKGVDASPTNMRELMLLNQGGKKEARTALPHPHEGVGSHADWKTALDFIMIYAATRCG